MDELTRDFLVPLLSEEEADRMVGWNWGEPLTRWGMRSVGNIPRMGEVIPSWSGAGLRLGPEPFTSPSPEPVLFSTRAMQWGSPEGL